jgi:hypothetical protein
LLTQAKEECEKQRQADSAQISAEPRAKTMALASDFPRLWNDPHTLDLDRKRRARRRLEDVTLRREQAVLVQVRFRGGATRELRLPLPRTAGELQRTEPEIVSETDRPSRQHTDGEIARLLNQREWRSSGGCGFTLRIVNRLRRDYQLKSLGDRLRGEGWLTACQIAAALECKPGRCTTSGSNPLDLTNFGAHKRSRNLTS